GRDATRRRVRTGLPRPRRPRPDLRCGGCPRSAHVGMPLTHARPSPLWWDELPPRPTRPAPAGDLEADVAIVGAGFTGLWTADYPKRPAADLEVVVLEREHAGFGASGRNGGWCHPEYPLGLATLVDRHGRDAALRFQRSAIDAVDEVGRVSASE